MKPGSKVELLCQVDIKEAGKQEVHVPKGTVGIIKSLWKNKNKFDVFVEFNEYLSGTKNIVFGIPLTVLVDLKHLKVLKSSS